MSKKGPLVAAALIVLTVSGCSSTTATGAGFQPNLDAMYLPLDDYAIDPVVSDYAENILVLECYEGHGFLDKTIVHVDTSKPGPETRNQMGRRIFDPDVAERYAYGEASDPRIDQEEAVAVHEQAFTPEQQQQWDACIETAREELPSPIPTLNFVEALASNAYQEALADPEVTAAAEAWHACMLPLGVAGLPSSPEEMHGVMEAAATPVDQQGVAVKDAACREDAGYRKALYEAEVEIQLRLVDENEDRLEQVRAEFEETENAIQKIISTQGRLS